MQISSRFTLAIHILVCIEIFKDEKVTSDFLAKSTNVNPVIVRNILGQLKHANIVCVSRGTGGAYIAKPLKDISFLSIYKAVDCVENDTLFHFHENPNPLCPVGRSIHSLLDDKLLGIQMAMEKELESITLQDVIDDAKKELKNN